MKGMDFLQDLMRDAGIIRGLALRPEQINRQLKTLRSRRRAARQVRRAMRRRRMARGQNLRTGA